MVIWPKRDRARWIPWALLFLFSLATLFLPAFGRLPHAATLTLVSGNLAIILFVVAIGRSIGASWVRFLIDGRNLISLSRLQMWLWTMLGFGALFAACSCRFWSGLPLLDVTLPGELIAAMGISYASAAAAPAVLYLKSQTTVSDTVPDGRGESGLLSRGGIISRSTRHPAYFRDLVMGDDVTNAGSVDLSKVQQLIVTLLLVGAYFVMLCSLFDAGGILAAKAAFPAMDGSFIEFMLMSHGAYLAYKAVTKPPATTSEPLNRPTPPDRNADLEP